MSELIFGVRTDDGRDFVLDAAGLTLTPNVSAQLPTGARVRVTNPDKTFSKFDSVAEKLNLGKWTAGNKPAEGTVGVVVGSVHHPSDEAVTIVGLRSEAGIDFLVEAEGLTIAPSASKALPNGTIVSVVNADKVYSKMDEKARELTLSKWRSGVKAVGGEGAVVLGSAPHPRDEAQQVVGIRTDNGLDLVICPEGVEVAPNASETFPRGARVRIVNGLKCYTKMDAMAKKLGLGKWIQGAKPPIAAPVKEKEAESEDGEPPVKKQKVLPIPGCVGEVRGSALHPDGKTMVIGVRTESGHDFLMESDGLELVPNMSEEFPAGSRIHIEAGKIYPKFDIKANELCLSKWISGAKPTGTLTGKVSASTGK
eukprot:NODE_846_length_1287_cov_266.356220_g644_i0.p1 GENE.NODE_846_length_1287_cov_266.356220_g644_i0~~NODE_846_length_1287_cov_266.356220_g644_i0.p1  ORF type:complete len:385 (-),score=108.63 NODE_846_length_1287_cov_266.356220_g644_i0:132-1232(-)